MNRSPAQFLLRLDDLCPTLHRARWERLLRLVEEFSLQPILAVVPENMDRELNLAPRDDRFWEEVRRLEATGADVALHGFRHLCRSKGRSLLPLHRHSEFAGVDEPTQQQWIESGLQLLRARGLSPRLWVGPRHGFDRTTLRVLRDVGIDLLSDGLAHRPFRREGLIWLPQQLWAPVEKDSGLWTICLHSNTLTSAQLEAFANFLRRHAAQFTSVDRVLEEWPCTPLSLGERLAEKLALWRIQLRHRRRRHHRSPSVRRRPVR